MTLASAVPRVSWKWYACRPTGIPASIGQLDELRHLGRNADADRVTETDLVDAERHEPDGDPDRVARIDPARVWAAERGRHIRAPPPAVLVSPREDGRERRKGRIDGHADVVLGEGIGRRGEHGDRVDPGRFGARETPLVRHQHREADPMPVRQAGDELVGVGELRDGLRRDERGRLDLAQAGVGQELDEPKLRPGRDRDRLVLQPIAWADLVDPDAAVAGPRLHRPTIRRGADPSPARAARSRPRCAG